MSANNRHIMQALWLALTLFSSIGQASQSTVYPLHRSDEIQRQVVDGNFISQNKLDTLIVYTSPGDTEDFASFDVTSPAYEWLEDKEVGKRIFKASHENIVITYQDKVIFTSDRLLFDYIRLIKACSGPEGVHRLLFGMHTGGTVSGEVRDMLFVYYDADKQLFQHKIIPERYLSPLCDMDGAAGNKKADENKQQALLSIYDQLSPKDNALPLDEYVQSREPVPTRKIEHQNFERLLNEARHLVPYEEEPVSQDESDEDYFKEELVYRDLAENENWRIVELSYLKLWSSWGVLLAQNKATEQWTAFYSSSAGDSNVLLYLDSNIELVGDAIRGKFAPYEQQRVEIALENFTVQKTHPYRFSDYFTDVYHGDIATLNIKSHEAAETFPTRIRQQLAKGVNFAGRYSLMTAGCGTYCQIIVITDVITGNVVKELHTEAGAEYQPGSQLLILNSKDICLTDDFYYKCKPAYFQMTAEKLNKI